MISIFINDKKIILTNDVYLDTSKHEGAKKSNSFHIDSINDLKKITSDYLNNHIPFKQIFLYGNIKQLYQNFIALYPEINAAGGVVFNENNDLLIIERRGIWDLPKGKTEAGENAHECAIREVMEETGVDHLSIVDRLPNSYHMYKINQQWVVKRTQWFLMQAPLQQFNPQVEEEITQVEWMPQSSIPKIISNTYASLKDIISAAV